jgi:hypothetical protein
VIAVVISSVCKCESHTSSRDEIKITVSDVSKHVREHLWREYGPEYFARLDEKELRIAIFGNLALNNEEVFETVKSHLEDKGILVELRKGYGVNMVKRP